MREGFLLYPERPNEKVLALKSHSTLLPRSVTSKHGACFSLAQPAKRDYPVS